MESIERKARSLLRRKKFTGEKFAELLEQIEEMLFLRGVRA